MKRSKGIWYIAGLPIALIVIGTVVQLTKSSLKPSKVEFECRGSIDCMPNIREDMVAYCTDDYHKWHKAHCPQPLHRSD